MDKANYRAEAQTIEDLYNRIEEAFALIGRDAEWIGFNDGSIHMWADESRPILSIEPTTTLLPEPTDTEVAA
jgi:hypothetical protein